MPGWSARAPASSASIARAIAGKTTVDDEVLDELEESPGEQRRGRGDHPAHHRPDPGAGERDKYVGTGELNALLATRSRP
jgi:hypothetical protein